MQRELGFPADYLLGLSARDAGTIHRPNAQSRSTALLVCGGLYSIPLSERHAECVSETRLHDYSGHAISLARTGLETPLERRGAIGWQG